jgi:ABC-type bacteriocin/lantibiotic exporter with double-glycine peptidase domain
MNNTLKLWRLLEKKDKNNTIMLLAITLVASVAEILNISLIIPFVTILSSEVEEFKWKDVIYGIYEYQSKNELIYFISVLAIGLTIASGLIRYYQMKMQVRISTEIAAKLSNKLFSKILLKELSWHNEKHSSQHLAGAEKARMLVSYVLYPTFFIITNSILGVSILFAMLANGKYFIIVPILFIGFIYFLISIKIKKHARLESKSFADTQAKLTECMQEALGSIKDLKIYNLEKFYSEKYQALITKMQKSLGKILQFAAGPRYFVEAFGIVSMLLIVVIINSLIESKYVMLSKEEFYGIILVIAIGFQRLLPIMQGIYSSYSNIQGTKQSVNDVIEILDDKEQLEYDVFNKKMSGDIHLKNVNFEYNNHKILNNVNIKIPQGLIVGIKGLSGTGKTTLVDIIMGLMRPSSGDIIIGAEHLDHTNKKEWLTNISYLAQSVFVIDGTIKENILLGNINKNNEGIYNTSVERADLVNFERMRGGITIGERGCRISGGQKQRVGIARAYYKESEYIILDEPTSALDNFSEQIIYDLLANKDEKETIIIISHSESLLDKVDLIFEIRDGDVYEIKKTII